MARPRLIGIDYGTKRVGIALSDPLHLFAQPEGTYAEDEAITRLDELYEDPGIETIVVGWPLELNGREGPATRFVQPFVHRIEKRYPHVAVVTWDERYSSARARKALVDAGVKRKNRRRRERVDAAAAAIILQEYMDEVSSE